MSDATNTQYPTVLVEHVAEGELRIGYKIREHSKPIWVAYASKGVAHVSILPGGDYSDPSLLRCISSCFLMAARSIADAV